MRDTIILFRPFACIEASVATLSPTDMHLVGRLNVSLIIKNILGALELCDHSTDLISNNACVNYYWNDGEPFLCDLVWYYNEALELHMDEGGLGFDYLKDYWDLLDDHDAIENEAPWTNDHGNIHKLLMLGRNRWYRRKFNDLYSMKLRNPSPYTETGKPRRVAPHKIRSICHEKENV